jgi:hypothetical protein
MNRRQQNLHKKKVNSKIGTRTVRHSLGLWTGGSGKISKPMPRFSMLISTKMNANHLVVVVE